MEDFYSKVPDDIDSVDILADGGIDEVEELSSNPKRGKQRGLFQHHRAGANLASASNLTLSDRVKLINQLKKGYSSSHSVASSALAQKNQALQFK